MIKNPYIIIEPANCHGGDFDYLMDLIDAFSSYTNSFGMKFQALSPDTLATPDFEWYPVYQTLTFSPNQWESIIQKAHSTKEVWMDIFDVYGVQILSENSPLIKGLKFQSSVLFNSEVIDALSALDLSQKTIILNVAAQSIEQIQERVNYIEETLKPQNIWIEIGFQAYPTELADSGLSKIKDLEQRFTLPIVFADHVDGKSQDAIYLPLLALQQGAQIIEKHVMLGDRETKYDHFSALSPDRFEVLVSTFQQYQQAFESPFINEREQEYLQKTVMIPVLKNNCSAGDLIHAKLDVHFRRSGKAGLSLSEIQRNQSEFKVLKHQKLKHDTLQESDFKKAKIGAIVACRLKSSRLKEKALLPIGDLPSVEFCLKNALKLDHVHAVILATSTEEQDAVLEKYTHSKDVHFFRGHPEDVMDRYIEACDKLELDIVVRITADMPYISSEICTPILESHFLSGADYSVGVDAAVGINLEIFNVSALKRIKSHFPSAAYSEYMTWYFQNNPEHVKINKVALPETFIRPYRLTLDYDEDLQLFNHIHQHFLSIGQKDYTLTEIISYLDENPNMAALNGHLTLKYKTDQSLIDLLNEKTKIKG